MSSETFKGISMLLVAKQRQQFFSRLTFFEDLLCPPSLAPHPDSEALLLPARMCAPPAARQTATAPPPVLPHLPSGQAQRSLSLEVAGDERSQG